MRNKRSAIYRGEPVPEQSQARWIPKERLCGEGTFIRTLMESPASELTIELWRLDEPRRMKWSRSTTASTRSMGTWCWR